MAWYTRRQSSGWSWGWRPRCRPGKLSFRLQSCCCSVAQWCLTLCDPMNSSTVGFPVFHHLPEYAQTHVHRVGDAIQPSHPLSPTPPPPALSLSSIRVFSSESDLLIRGQSIGASASASVPPVNFQGWFPLRWTGLISCTGSTPLSNSVAGAEIRKWAATVTLLVFPLTLTVIKMISLGPLCPLASYLLSRPLLSCSHFFPHFCVCSHCPLLNNHWNIPITYIEDFKKLFVSHARPFILWLYLMQQLPFPVSTHCPLIGGFLLLWGVQAGHIVSFALRCFPRWLSSKESTAVQESQETQVQSLGWEVPLEEGSATHSSILAWRILWTEEPGSLQSIGLQRVGYHWSDVALTHRPVQASLSISPLPPSTLKVSCFDPSHHRWNEPLLFPLILLYV